MYFHIILLTTHNHKAPPITPTAIPQLVPMLSEGHGYSLLSGAFTLIVADF